MNELSITTLSEQEQQFLYNLEVLGLSQQRSAEIAGLGYSPSVVLKRPEVIAAREKIRQTVRASVQLTKEDVIRGIKSAIDQAVLLADPMAQIAGWREVSKMLGYDAPRKVEVVLSADAVTARKQLAQIPDDELVTMLGADNVIDVDFYDVREHATN